MRAANLLHIRVSSFKQYLGRKPNAVIHLNVVKMQYPKLYGLGTIVTGVQIPVEWVTSLFIQIFIIWQLVLEMKTRRAHT